MQQSVRKLPTVLEILKQSNVTSAPRHTHVCIFRILLWKASKTALCLINVNKEKKILVSVSCLPSRFLKVNSTEITNLLLYYDYLEDLQFGFLKIKSPKHTFYTIYLMPTSMLCCYLCTVFPSSLFPSSLRQKFYMRPQDCLKDTHLSSLRIFFFRTVVPLMVLNAVSIRV
jgi:hypothetical protein